MGKEGKIIAYLVKIHASRADAGYYEHLDENEREKETKIFCLWIHILTRSMTCENIDYFSMRSLVELRIMGENEITEMLKEIGDHRDYEWYDEDFAGRPLSSGTKLPVSRILAIAEPKMSALLHLTDF